MLAARTVFALGRANFLLAAVRARACVDVCVCSMVRHACVCVCVYIHRMGGFGTRTPRHATPLTSHAADQTTSTHPKSVSSASSKQHSNTTTSKAGTTTQEVHTEGPTQGAAAAVAAAARTPAPTPSARGTCRRPAAPPAGTAAASRARRRGTGRGRRRRRRRTGACHRRGLRTAGRMGATLSRRRAGRRARRAAEADLQGVVVGRHRMEGVCHRQVDEGGGLGREVVGIGRHHPLLATHLDGSSVIRAQQSQLPTGTGHHWGLWVSAWALLQRRGHLAT